MKRPLAAVAGLTIVGSALAVAPASAATTKNATLTWKINKCAFTPGIASCGSLTETQSTAGSVARTDSGCITAQHQARNPPQPWPTSTASRSPSDRMTPDTSADRVRGS